MKCPMCERKMQIVGVLEFSDKQVHECNDCKFVAISKVPRAVSRALGDAKNNEG